MHNLLSKEHSHLAPQTSIGGRSFGDIISRVDSLLMVLKSCKAESCRKPWDSLHKDGNVKSLEEALDINFDAFYERQPKSAFLLANWVIFVTRKDPSMSILG